MSLWDASSFQSLLGLFLLPCCLLILFLDFLGESIVCSLFSTLQTFEMLATISEFAESTCPFASSPKLNYKGVVKSFDHISLFNLGIVFFYIHFQGLELLCNFIDIKFYSLFVCLKIFTKLGNIIFIVINMLTDMIFSISLSVK